MATLYEETTNVGFHFSHTLIPRKEPLMSKIESVNNEIEKLEAQTRG